MKFSELNKVILVEGINDTGIFKALFLAGLPGSGKSTIAKKLLMHCRAHPRIIDFDRFYEYVSKKAGVNIGPNAKPEETKPLLTRAEHLTREQLTYYVHGMLPMIIDGTSENPTAMLNRIDLLYSIGYDIGMLWIRKDLETSLTRAASRERYVKPEYIEQVAHNEDKNIQYLSTRIPTQGGGPFIVLDANSDISDFDDIVNQVNDFFTSPIMNPRGNKYFNVIKSSRGKNLSPSVYPDIDTVGTALSKWTSKTR